MDWSHLRSEPSSLGHSASGHTFAEAQVDQRVVWITPGPGPPMAALSHDVHPIFRSFSPGRARGFGETSDPLTVTPSLLAQIAS